MKEEEVNRCQIQEWYPKFKSLSIRTITHELPESFVEYLLDDSGPFVLPMSVSNEDALPNRVHNPIDEEDYQVSEGSGDEAEQPQSPPSFPELELKIKQSIETLGGAVFPKLNWSSPKDSAWISMSGTLRCTSFSEIALLLRSSDSLVHDLCHAYDSCSDKILSRPSSFFLALRKWYSDLLPEMEFRCFVWGNRLVGISQREVTTCYPILLEKKTDLQLLIEEFFLDNVRMKFESENYTFDVYVTKDERAKIVDFNPWGAFTLPLLFTWEELEQDVREGASTDFRIVESQCGIRPGLKTAVPQDYLDTSPGSGWDQFLRKVDAEFQQQRISHENGAGA
ncbi:cell division cycle protein 123 homolog [Ricinus communis]|uniref:cell division cycle protein 123 homolog n=1 Tax=Ricinus communis TaxID=3988 RepID=UPI00201A3693|nr:cell division cycle protein 123 homolog [Ricinus communis]XP_015576980.2 cell division cycle protein 123 homolog [Ricinus communis]XP_048232046.1 cell division cycle protein 123 homolog [Ricinus communis]XP_048232047.1 cell division cycle protein 123 homolog [Ricinus communis]